MQTHLASLLAATLISIQFIPPAAVAERLPILQGPTDASTTQVAVSVPKGKNLVMRLLDGAKVLDPSSTRRHSKPFSDHEVVQVVFRGLDPVRRYTFEVRDDSGAILDSRALRSLNLRRRPARLAIVSCMADKFVAEGAPLWTDLLKRKPDVIVFAGDNVYADARGKPADPERLWNRNAETRSALAIFKSPELIPILATWDDHDFGIDDGDGTFPHKEAAREAFEAFFPQADGVGGIRRGPGVSRRVDLFGNRFFLMDSRTFRNQRDRVGVVTHWGEEQSLWLRKELHKGDGPIWLVNGSQFFGGYHEFESFEREHPVDLSRWLKEFSHLRWPVVFVSGDRHLSEILEVKWPELGYRSFELTSSGIHSFVSRPKDPPVPPRAEPPVAGPFGEMNYMIVETAFTSVGRPIVQLDVKVFGPKQKIGFSKRLGIAR